MAGMIFPENMEVYMEFFSSAITTLQTLVVALGAGLGVWGVVNLLEGYGADNPGSKRQGMKQLMAGGGIILLGTTLIPLLSGLFSGRRFMGFLTDWITNWLKELLIGGIMDNLSGLFDTVNARVGEIAVQVGTAPAQWNAGVFSLIRRLSETVILPIAGLVLTFVATYELIQLLVERNNLHDLDYWIFFKWIFKTACAILILSNTFNIVMAVFDVAQRVVAQSAGLIQGSTDVSPDMLADLEEALEGMDLGPLLGLWLQSFVVQLTMTALNIVIFVIVYGRMIEIYMLTSLAPLPVATLGNRELGGAGQNYLRSLFAVGFQGMLILVCVGIYAVLIQSIAGGGDPIGAIWGTIGYTVLLCYCLFKTGSIARSILGAH